MKDFTYYFLCSLPFMLVMSFTLSTRRISAENWQFWVIAALIGVAFWAGKFR